MNLDSRRSLLSQTPLRLTAFVSFLAVCIAAVAFTSASHGSEATGVPESVAVSPDADPEIEDATAGPEWLLDAMRIPLGLSARVVEEEDAQVEAPPAVDDGKAPGAFPDLSHVQAVDVLRGKFPDLIDLSFDPAPPLKEDERITGYRSPFIAELEMANGEKAVAESLLPLLATDAEGKESPVDLRLEDGPEGLEPASTTVPVVIGKELAEGLRLPSLDLALIPVDDAHEPLQGSAGVEGAVALFANTQVDTDTLVKPMPVGFQTHSILRSPASPETLRFSVEVGEKGAHLTSLEGGSILVEAEGRPVTAIPPALARDATGSEAPVGMEIEDDTIVLRVDHREEDFQYPIDVDPTVADWNAFSSTAGNWVYSTNVPGQILGTLDTTWADALQIENHFNYPQPSNWLNYGNYGAWSYQTQGVSRIYQFDAAIGGRNTNGTFVAIFSPSGSEGIQWLAPYFGTGETNHTVCAKTCASSGGSASNAAVYELVATASGTEYIHSEMMGATVRIVQDQPASITFNTTAATINGKPNALYQGGDWIKTSQNAWIGVSANDPGLGLNWASLTSPGYSPWNGNYNQTQPGCVGVQCDPGWSLSRAVGNLPDGERKIKAYVSNAAISSEATKYVKIDNTGPTAALSGLGSSYIAGVGENDVTFEVTDGTQTTASSGVGAGQISVSLDGEEILAPGGGGCSPGPCTVKREYSFLGRDIGVGEHTLSVTAVDKIGNKATTEFRFVVVGNVGPAVDMGPGKLDIRSGDFFLTESDISEAAAGATLSLTRSHESLRKTAEEGPLGPGWQLTFGAWRSLLRMADGTSVISDAKGRQVVFDEINNGYFHPVADYPGWTLRYFAGEQLYKLTSPEGGMTSFKRPSGGPTHLYMPSVVTKPDGTQATSFTFQYVSGMARPSYVTAPLPEGTDELGEKGPRYLSFSYDSSTTATGGAPSEWGNYKGRLSSVALVAYDPESGFLDSRSVIEYAYDASGRLRAVWDPRISPALKTTYGYDQFGHVTSVTPPGQQPWVLKYGSVPGSSHSDWLLAASRPGASEDLGDGDAPINTKPPYFSTAPVVGKAQSVWNGAWENDPLGYTYQWSRCDAAGENCVPIAGATYQGYKPKAADIGHSLLATVTATNGGGSATASTTPSGPVMKTAVDMSHDFSFGTKGSEPAQLTQPYDLAAASDGSVWVADTFNNRVKRFSAEGQFLSQFGVQGGGEGQLNLPVGMTVDAQGHLWVANFWNHHVQEFNAQGQVLTQFGAVGSEPGQLKNPTRIAIDSAGNVWVADSGNHRVQKFSATGTYLGGFGSQGTGNGQFQFPAGIAIDSTGNLWIADRDNHRVQKFSASGGYLGQFGGEGVGPGQLKAPTGIAIDSLGSIWVTERDNHRVQGFNGKGEYLTHFGGEGSEPGQMKGPSGVAASVGGNLWTADTQNHRVQRWSKIAFSPAANRTFDFSFGASGSGNGQFNVATDVEVDPTDGTIWVTDDDNDRVQHFSAAGQYIGQFKSCNDPAAVEADSGGDLVVVCSSADKIHKYNNKGELLKQLVSASGSGSGQVRFPLDLALDSQESFWVANNENDRLDKFDADGKFIKSTAAGVVNRPWGVAVAPDGRIWVAEWSRVSVLDSDGKLLFRFGSFGTGTGQFQRAVDVEVDDDGNAWITDAVNNRVQVFNEAGEYIGQFGEEGSGAGQLDTDWWLRIALGENDDVWVVDQGNHRVQRWSKPQPAEGEAPPPPDPTTAVWTAIYDVPLSGSGTPNMTSASVSRWGQSTAPAEAAAIFPPDQVPGRHPTNYKRATIHYMDGTGRIVNVRSPGNRISTEEHDQYGNVTRTLTPQNRARSLAAGASSQGTSEQLDTRLTYSEGGSRLLTVLGPKRKVKLESGSEVEARLSTKYFYDEGAPEGGPYDLLTKQTEGALVGGVEHDVKTKTFGYDGQNGIGWKLRKPTSETVDPAGLKLTTVTLYDEKTADIVETRMPSNPQGGDASATQMVHYTAKTNKVPACGGHPEWAGLTCQIRPAVQPGTPGLPALPVSTTTYNVYNQPLTTTEVAGEHSRVATIDYDSAGRPVGASLSSTSGKPMPEVHTVYDEDTGLPVVVNTEAEYLLSEYDSLGRRISYTDADGNVSTYEYDSLGRVAEVFDGKGTQAFSYDSITGDLIEVVDSAIGAMTAEYDAGGKMTSMSYANGLEAKYAYDGGGFATGLEYVKTTNCSQNCVWFEEVLSPSVHGKIFGQDSSLADFDYGYDAAGRLTRVEEIAQGKGCVTRLYAYDANTNRTSATTRGPGEGGSCAKTGGTTLTTAFDKADRLVGEGVSYDAFGNITSLPGGYAGGSLLSSTYYADNSAASMTQNGRTLEYLLDPAGREHETRTVEGASESILTSHFSGDSDSPTWTEDDSGNWTRYVSGIGGMGAIQSSTEGIDLQLADLQGNIIGTVPYGGGGAEVLAFMDGATEYGVPKGSNPPKYSWQGSSQRPTEMTSGVVNMGARTYVPTIGRFMQTDPIPGGSANAYAYVKGDPVGETDPSGEYTPGAAPTWLTELMENPPGMPPPPPDPEVEAELIEEAVRGEGDFQFLFFTPPVAAVPAADNAEAIAQATVAIWTRVVQVVLQKAAEVAAKFGGSAAHVFKVAVRWGINAAKGGARTARTVGDWVRREYATRAPELIECGHAAFDAMQRSSPADWKARAAAAGAACIEAIKRYRGS
jgi:RHS repeat-associated protein